MRVHLSNCLGGLALAAILTLPAQADPVADFYKGKTVTLIAGYSAGGGFDAYSRIMANHIGKYIPGHPRVVVQNMPGAGSLRAASHVYNVSPKDGSVISLTRAPVIAPLLGKTTGAGFDVAKFTWLGSGASDLTVCAVLGNPTIKTMADTFKHELTLGGLGPGSDEDMYTKILRKLLGVKAKLVTGYPGGAEMVLAVERGELDGRCGWAWSSIKLTRPQWIAQKKIRVLAALALKRSPELPDVPAIMEFVKQERHKQIFRFVLNAQTLGRPFVAPPGIPEDRANALRKAFEDTMKDQAYLAEMKAKKLDVGPIRWQDITPLLTDFYATPKDVVEETRAIISE
ncbi:MAG: Bug family tripartite tricarboxylate transporter substrate binding protein [Xanthobacteraceae bacterium]